MESFERPVLEAHSSSGEIQMVLQKPAEDIPSGNGDTVSSILERAMDEYQLEQGKLFHFSLCVPILHKIPQFDPVTIKLLVDTQPPLVTSVMGSSSQRSIGSKAEESIKKEETTTNSNINIIQGEINKLVDSTIQKEAFLELKMLGKYYCSKIDTENAMLNDIELKKVVEENRKAREQEKLLLNRLFLYRHRLSLLYQLKRYRV
jgi:hypothetical protein